MIAAGIVAPEEPWLLRRRPERQNMQQTFEHLLGLPASAALGILASYGITAVEVVPTSAPARRNPSPEDALRTEEGEQRGYASTRVVAVEDDGHRLIVSRFLTGDPRDRERSGQ